MAKPKKTVVLKSGDQIAYLEIPTDPIPYGKSPIAEYLKTQSKAQKLRGTQTELNYKRKHVTDSDSGHGQPDGSRFGSRQENLQLKHQLNYELTQLQNQQVTDTCDNFSTRLNRYLRIRSIKYLLNHFFKS